MSMLAEPRSRQKWSDDPRNTRWANDKSKFGYQLMTKMGWSEGKGLGQKESGTTSHIKVMKRKSNAGIGTKRSHDDDWIAHQNDFNDLLNSLNQGSNNSDSGKKVKSLEDRVRLSKKKILYTKFVKSKDLSNASSQDLACIFGQRRSKSAPATPQMSDNEGNDSDISAASCPVVKDNTESTEHGFTTIRTGMSVTDYFSQKMAALAKSREKSQVSEKAKKSIGVVFKIESENDSSEKTDELSHDIQIDDDCENQVITCKKKKKRTRDENHNSNNKDVENEASDISKKKKKKKRTEKEKNSSSGSDDVENETNVVSTEKKKKKKKRTDNEHISCSDSENVNISKEKKYFDENETNNSQDDLNKKKKKKRKRKIEEEIEDEDGSKRLKYTEDTISQKKKKNDATELTENEKEDSKEKVKKKKKKSKKSI